jgi:hypothetical protein
MEKEIARSGLVQVLCHPELAWMYREHLHDQVRSENLAFFLQVEQYRRNAEQRQALFDEILEKFFSVESTYAIVVSKDAVNEIRARGATADAFDELYQETWRDLEHELPKFYTREMYINWQSMVLPHARSSLVATFLIFQQTAPTSQHCLLRASAMSLTHGGCSTKRKSQTLASTASTLSEEIC